jgi:hypothetical protein
MSADAACCWQELTDEDRQAVFDSLPNALDGFLKLWGWLHFAKAIEAQVKKKNAAHDDLLEALKEARETLAMLTDPERIQQSRVQIAWAQAVAAEAKARAAIAKATGKE